ncbi:hypothetical protein DERF_006404 [Dermatophagoides farinae]|uniref:Uncharacterized protein n=1 Tax=Dermatophagoides farinae TaxID=6954 RepID=A0A922I5D8_DERFA|nr:hypothetical protein DERF_006404 [Dermatophagoides farinae]
MKKINNPIIINNSRLFRNTVIINNRKNLNNNNNNAKYKSTKNLPTDLKNAVDLLIGRKSSKKGGEYVVLT